MPRLPEHLHLYWDHSEDNFNENWSELVRAQDYNGPFRHYKSWSCPDCGDFWRAGIRSMTTRSNPCRHCNPTSQGISSNRRGYCHISGIDSVGTVRPDIASRWGITYIDENTLLFLNEYWPDELLPNSKERVHLTCLRRVDDMGRHDALGERLCLHITHQRLGSLMQSEGTGRSGVNCDSCSWGGDSVNNYDQKNALSVTNANVAQELIFHPRGRNADQVKAGSGELCRWRCGICDHEFPAEINARTLNATRDARTECPACINRQVHIDGRNCLGCVFPNVAMHWDWQRNGDTNPCNIPFGSGFEAHWICRHTAFTADGSECGHRRLQQVYSRTQLLLDGSSHVPCERCCPSGGYRDFLQGYYYVLEWDHPQHGSIFKNGITNVPLDRIGRLARSLHRALGLTYRFVQIITNEDGAAIRRLETRNLRFTSLLVTLDEGVEDLDGRNEMFSRNMLEHANERGFIPDGSVDVTEELRTIIEDEIIRIVAIEEE